MKLLVFLLLPCLSLSEVVPGFSKCRKFFVYKVPPKFTPELSNTQKICQCVWDEYDEQKYLYATLYNTDWRIPVYSAYVFYRSESVGRCDPWYIEPQLDEDAEPCMAPKGCTICNNQAVNSDYEKQDPNNPYDKGHLYPVQHTYNHVSMLATSTLTNAAPQDSTFNRGQWKKHEKDVATDLTACESEAYVVTGVVPNTNIPTLKDRVTVSKYYWRATCCLKNGVYTGKGYFGPDGNNKIVTPLSITALQRKLAIDYGVNTIVIFPGVEGGCE
ncbi:hypothetical protein R3I93_023080 [Phoxinus phoxinus]|uniref:Endonuclease domain-containing 1 protein n=1 Tax=Phoxinus phoxinus TaxID=58324 RepID=A0AAN9C7C2_9TELE